MVISTGDSERMGKYFGFSLGARLAGFGWCLSHVGTRFSFK